VPSRRLKRGRIGCLVGETLRAFDREAERRYRPPCASRVRTARRVVHNGCTHCNAAARHARRLCTV
jgi:hypothetical protein